MHAPLASFGPSLRPSALARSNASAVASASVLGPAGLLRKAFHAVIPSALALLVIATGSNARADDSIKADTTLKSNNSVVTRSKAADGKTTYTITGGASQNSGRYLFHSFAAFNLLLNEVGHFDNLTTVNTIFSRVTGLNQSSINGLIKANGAANLYLINPVPSRPVQLRHYFSMAKSSVPSRQMLNRCSLATLSPVCSLAPHQPRSVMQVFWW